MKRLWLGLGVSLGIAAFTVAAEEPAHLATPLPIPAATLGNPKPASLGIPRAASKSTPETVTVGYPQLTVRAQSPEPLLTLSTEEPLLKKDPKKEEPRKDDSSTKKMPIPEIKEGESSNSKDKKVLPVPTPVLTSPGTLTNPITVPGPALSNPVISGPVVSSPVISLPAPQAETPGCALPATAMPFVREGSRFYSSGEYLMWWMKSYSVPVLATTGPVGSGGVIGQPGVVPILGGGNSDPTGRSGARINLGWWFGQCQEYALDANFFFLGDRGTNTGVNSNAYPLIARPFVVPNTLIDPNNQALRLNIPGNFSEITALQGLQMGGIGVHTDSLFWGGDLSVRRKLRDNGVGRLDMLVGYRHLQLEENLEITESFMGVPGSRNDGLSGIIFDKFRTTNSFNGAMLGLLYERQSGRWHLGLNTRLGVGVTNSTLTVDGGITQFGANAVTPTVPGGLLALNSNLGYYSKNTLSFVPEAGINLGYDVTPRLRLSVGYNLIYWSSVLRPGEQIDNTLDLHRIPVLNDPRVFPQINNVAPANTYRPAATLKESDLWIQGVNFGVKWMW